MTERLHLFMQGDTAAADALLREILPTLRGIAAREVNRRPGVAHLSKTELVQELWLKEFSKGGWRFNDKKHFYILASNAMRHILIDAARKLLAGRRRGNEVTLAWAEASPLLGTSVKDAEQIVEIGILMDRLKSEIPDAACIIDMHYFTGFTLEEIAEKTGLTVKQVRTRWIKGIDWLKRASKSRNSSFRRDCDV
jgi:RNA polymerase sigma factor (TIGR02999 family)